MGTNWVGRTDLRFGSTVIRSLIHARYGRCREMTEHGFHSGRNLFLSLVGSPDIQFKWLESLANVFIFSLTKRIKFHNIQHGKA